VRSDGQFHESPIGNTTSQAPVSKRLWDNREAMIRDQKQLRDVLSRAVL
jgi:hypothetical protein